MKLKARFYFAITGVMARGGSAPRAALGALLIEGQAVAAGPHSHESGYEAAADEAWALRNEVRRQREEIGKLRGEIERLEGRLAFHRGRGAVVREHDGRAAHLARALAAAARERAAEPKPIWDRLRAAWGQRRGAALSGAAIRL